MASSEGIRQEWRRPAPPDAALQPPPPARGRRLERRVVGLFLGLLLVVQASTFVAIRSGIDRIARAEVAGELQSGENVLRVIVSHDAENLNEAAHLLAADYGFRSAIASGDRATLVDALDNQAARIGATIALYTDARRHLVASTMADPSAALALVQDGAREARPSVVQVLGGWPFQLVTVPVKAPTTIGWVSMGFPVRGQLLDGMDRLTKLKMAMLAREHGGPWRVLPIGEHATELQPLAAQLRPGTAATAVRLNGDDTSVRIVHLGSNASHQEVAAALLRSIDEAVAPYRELQISLLGINLVGVAVFVVGSVVTARRIIRPIQALSGSAERLGAGDYTTSVVVVTGDEVEDLAQAFEAMRLGMQQREAKIRQLAYWDALTGLPNRAQFIVELQARLEQARVAGESCTVLMLDLDRFKNVNDVLGHAFGDQLLCRIADRLNKDVRRKDDVVARLGGDEFAVCMPQATATEGGQLARRLRNSLEQPLTIDDHAVDVSAGVGIATFPDDGTDASALLRRAETAMYSAKRGQSGVVHYNADIDATSAGSLSLLSELRTAVDDGQLRLYLQPKFSLETGRLTGAEALIRWQHPERGLVPPFRFIPFAEQTGFIRKLTVWMFERCSRRQSLLRDDGLALTISVNLSTRDLLDLDLPARLERRMSQDGVDPSTICVEITESAIMEDPTRALQTLQRLHAMGLRLSIDDFGTGYSSLAYLKKLPLHELKIDQSFIMAMETDRADLKIVRSTIDLAHNLGLSVVAEGVESAQSWALLRAMKCDQAQGFFMARPMPEEDFPAWAMRWTSPVTRLRTEFADLI